MPKHYTDEKNVHILIALLKENGIKKVVASPGATNVTFIGSIQTPYELNDKKIYNEPCFIDLSKFSKQIIVTKNENTKSTDSTAETILFINTPPAYFYAEGRCVITLQIRGRCHPL